MKIGIDPGHGGRDPGAVSPVRPALGDKIYTEEEDITLEIAKRLQGVLLACGHQVVMTKMGDADVSLSERTRVLNAAKCDIAVSIHLNSSTNSTATYISTFIQMTGGQAEKLARCIQPRITATTGWPDGGIRVKNLHMTRETKMPAVLLELGFVSNPGEELQLNDSLFRGKLAVAIAEGILTYAGKVEPWQKYLLNFATDTGAGQAEIERTQQVWKQKNATKDTTGMEAAHRWANQIRQAMGLAIS